MTESELALHLAKRGAGLTAREARVLIDVLTERTRQDAKWGEQNHDPFVYLTILGEEVGEACEAALKARFGGGTVAHLREELIQAAAVAVALVECLDREKWQWGSARR